MNTNKLSKVKKHLGLSSLIFDNTTDMLLAIQYYLFINCSSIKERTIEKIYKDLMDKKPEKQVSCLTLQDNIKNFIKTEHTTNESHYVLLCLFCHTKDPSYLNIINPDVLQYFFDTITHNNINNDITILVQNSFTARVASNVESIQNTDNMSYLKHSILPNVLPIVLILYLKSMKGKEKSLTEKQMVIYNYAHETYKKQTIFYFVYGTLINGQNNHSVINNATYIGPGKTLKKHTMYIYDLDSDSYPNVAYSPELYQIEGELYEIKPGDTKTVQDLDELEGIESGHYTKEIVDIIHNGVPVKAYMYFNQNNDTDPDYIKNETGSFVEFMNNREETSSFNEFLQEQPEEPTDKIWYFAYGSNMDEDRLRSRLDDWEHDLGRHIGILKDHKLVFNKQASGLKGQGYGSVIPKSGQNVEGVLYLINKKDIQGLRDAEGYPYHYTEEIMTVYADKNPVQALVYVAHPDYVNNKLKPSKKYLGFLLKGKDILSKQYYEKLKQIETY